MIINKITLHNFRQYYGTQTIEFSNSNDKNVTVIHGENGSGKTALLNAFNWCLYGVTDLPDSNQLMNSQAVETTESGDTIAMFVEMEFISKEITYILKRSKTGRKNTGEIRNEESDVLLQFYEEGRLKKLSNPSVEINRVMPENLRNYFFFDGERIDSLSRHEDNGEIQDAVKIVMDLEIIDRGIKHIEDVGKEFQKEWISLADEKTKELLETEEALESEKTDLIEEEAQLKSNIKILTRQVADIDGQLNLVRGIEERYKERKELEANLKETKQKMDHKEDALSRLVSKYGYLAMSSILSEKAKEKFKSVGEPEGIVYPNLSTDLIEAILNKNVCICGQDLCNQQKKHLESLLGQLGPQNQTMLKNNLYSQIALILDKKEWFMEDVSTHERELYQLKELVRDIGNRLEEISHDLSNRSVENVSALENNRREHQEKSIKYQKRIGVIEHTLEDLDKRRREVAKQISKQQQIEDKAQLAKRRLNTSNKLKEVMQKIYVLKEKEVKTDLQETIEGVYSNFLRKGYKISLTDDFKLEVKNHYGEKVPLSQGERQITSLSFIGAIVDIARKHYQRKATKVINEGGIYPLVMDSPFGALDSNHRERVAEGIPKLSEQIIVIVSTSQWKGEVERSLSPYVSNHYELHYHDPRKNDSHEYTEIRRW
ncbi:AAA family ATPase [Bacillus sp. SB49]|uniref:AAA family ATPase n=1 Tax=Bacillus sp. SB49 TaxID=1071080 RepID=UPI00047D3F6E|nr:AAA family ATPase [Bacillus sp. SB49]QHT48502.1 AAA family ATPase [Bacillus sp. SB49]